MSNFRKSNLSQKGNDPLFTILQGHEIFYTGLYNVCICHSLQRVLDRVYKERITIKTTSFIITRKGLNL